MDGATFNKTYLPLRNTILAVCITLLSDQEAARDTTQDVFLKLWEQKETLDEVLSPKAFVVRMAKNRCLDRLKSAGERLRDRSESAELALLQKVDAAPTPHETLVGKSCEERLDKWAKQLKEPQKSIFRLRHYEMLSNAETAEQLGLQESTVRSAISRLRKEARNIITEE